MSINASFHDPKTASHKTLPGVANDTLSFDGKDGEYVSLFVPAHVAEHTAAAFNRAMQAVPDGDGWTYTTKSGVWHISTPMMQSFYYAQHEDVTGDDDPAYLTADARSLIGCMDEIDAIEADRGCPVCHRLFDDGELAHCHDGNERCDDCAQDWLKNEAEMREMAEDDKAHAAMEKAAGL